MKFLLVNISYPRVGQLQRKDSGDSRIRVAQIITGLVLGGGATVMLSIAKNINRSLFHIDFFCVIEGGELLTEIEQLGFTVNVLKVFSAQRFPKYSLVQVLRLAGHLRRGRYDIVHTHLYKADVAGRLAALLGGVPHIIKTLHNMGTWKNRSQLFVDRILNFFTDKIVCVSATQQKHVEIQEKIPQSKLVTIRNGVDLSCFQKTVHRNIYLQELGIDCSGFIVGTVGRLIPEKGQLHFLQSIPAILKIHPNTHFIIVGDGPMRETLTDYVEKMSFKENVTFTGLRNDVAELLAIFDIFVFPSVVEAFGIAVLEAMASRCPVVCSSIPQLKEIVTDEVNGMLFETGNPISIAAKINHLFENEALRKEIVHNAYTMIRKTLTEKHMILSLEKVYFSLFK